MKYKTMQSGEWFRQWQGSKIACCNCGLVHNFDFKMRKGKLWLRATANNRATGQVRRHMKPKAPKYVAVVSGKNQVKDVGGVLRKYLEEL